MAKGWAWWLGLVVCPVNGLFSSSAVLARAPILQALSRLIAPVVIVWYLLGPEERQVFGG